MDLDEWRGGVSEDPIDPALPIIDCHHHLWPEAPVPDMEAWGAEDLFAYIADCGHNIQATVFVEAGARYRKQGPTALAPVGETEYAETTGREAAAQGASASGAIAGIVSAANMLLGDAVEDVLLGHLAASSRVRGVRFAVAFDPDMPYDMGTRPGMTREPAFRAAFARLAPHDLSFDIWLMQPQMAELCDLADSFPETNIILDHLGTPMGVGRFATDRDAAFADWKSLLGEVARRPNVMLKLGGLNMPLTGLCVDHTAALPWTSEQMAQAQSRHLLTAIDLFGTKRCMFESNFPVDRSLTGGTAIWNSFKRVVGDFTAEEKRALFHDNAQRIYRLSVPGETTHR